LVFQEGKIVQFLVALGTFAGTYLYLYRADRGHVPKVRRIAGLDMIPEVVGRCVEMNKPIHVTTGSYGGLIEKEAATNLAGLAVLGYVCRLAAKLGAHVIFTAKLPEMFVAAQDIMRTSFAAEGHPELEPDNRFLPGSSYQVGTMSAFYEDGSAGNVAIGLVSADCYYWTTAARDVGAIQVCGTDSMSQTPVLVTQCDYVLLGDECHAAGAITSGDDSQVACLVGLDLSKYAFLGISILGIVLTTAGSSLLNDLLKM
jgi:hypothetical protein